MAGSEDKQKEARIGYVADVAKAVRKAKAGTGKALGQTVFFVGAGCSLSAGIPLVADMAKSLVKRLAGESGCPENIRDDAEAAYRWLVAEKEMRGCFVNVLPGNTPAANSGIDWPAVYDAAFSESYDTPDDARELFSEFVDAAQGKINWSHLCLGELVRRRLVSTVITTNFDQLVLSGLVRSGVLPVVCDGNESLTRVQGVPSHPQLIELHGSRHTYRLRNSKEDVAELADDEPTIAAIGQIFQNLRALVVVGYGGREDGIMDLMIKVADLYRDKRLMWVAHDKDPARLSPKAKSFLATSRNARLIVGQDSDSFFLQLLKELKIGSPETIREPLFLASANSSSLASHDSEGIADGSTIIQEIRRHCDEIAVMDQALRTYRENRGKTENALVRAREMRLAGKLDGALEVLTSVPESLRDRQIWRAIGEIGREFAETSPSNENFETAAKAWRKLLDTDQTVELISAKYQLALTMRSRGAQQGDAAALVQSIEIFEELLRRDDLATAGIQKASLRNSYGFALRTLGEREAGGAGAKRLEQAIAAYQEALNEWSREHAPLDWAMTQNNFGNALARLGERESGTEKLEAAVAAYREALKEWTRERVPLDWALAQTNLGTALVSLGERQSGTETLEQAVAACLEALKERTRRKVPQQWANTQMNLGNAYVELGRRADGKERLEEAVAAYRDALEERPRERLPQQWAMTKSNLGAALLELGKREDGTERLNEALTAVCEALEERTRDRGAMQWAISRAILGSVLFELGKRESGTSRLNEAVAAYRAALQVFSPDSSPLRHDQASKGLKRASDELERRQKQPLTATP